MKQNTQKQPPQNPTKKPQQTHRKTRAKKNLSNPPNHYKRIYFLFLFLLENLKWKVMFIFILSVHVLQLERGIILFVFFALVITATTATTILLEMTNLWILNPGNVADC